MTSHHVVAVVAGLLVSVPAVAAPSRPAPGTGLELLGAMREAYQGRWFTTLTFTQKTTTRDKSGKETVATWYESLRYTEQGHTQLRIDIGSPNEGNGVLYTADSLNVFRAGKRVAARSGGNALLPLIVGAYVQPVERTVAELGPTGVDLGRSLVAGRWDGKPVWIVGASASGDSTSPQFWVTQDTKVVVRAIFAPVIGTPVMDMRMGRVVKAGGGWLATRCEFYVEGKLSQVEEYLGPKVGIALSASLFDPNGWTTADHWAK